MSRKIIHICLFSLGGVVLLLLLVVLVRPTVKVIYLRDSIIQGLSAALGGRQVEVKGDIILQLGLRPELVLSQVRVAAPPPRAEAVSAHLERLWLKVSLPKLFLQEELDMEGFRADNLLLFPPQIRADSANAEAAGLRFQHIQGAIRLRQDLAEVGDLSVRVGDSNLTGSMLLTAQAEKLRLRLVLDAPTIRLEDLETLAYFSAPPKKDSGPSAGAAPIMWPAMNRLIAAVADRLDAEVSLRTGEVLTGGRKLGAGQLKVSVAEGSLRVDSLEIALPGGIIKGTLNMRPGGDATRVEVAVEATNFDYGVLARWHNPSSILAGVVNLDASLKAGITSPDQFLPRADGRVRLAVWPWNLEAGVFDLWATNLIGAILSRLSDRFRSKINCMFIDLAMKQGILTSHTFLIDASKVRVNGEVRADFRERRLKLALYPAAKRAELFSLETPIGGEGRFEDFELGVVPGGGLMSIINMVLSPITVPLKRLFQDPLPQDGRDVCPQPGRWPSDKPKPVGGQPGQASP